MSKKWTFLFLIGVIVTLCIITILNKPTEKDFTLWLHEEYNIDCNKDCSIIELENGNGNITERIKLANGNGAYSPGLFTLRINRHYISLNDPNRIFSLEVIGFNGRFYEMNSKRNDLSLHNNIIDN
ncbi:hypothetical protein [Rossellomorea aquimaris]|uniref:Uncharacterized protein n=1 Tax=Rossellomorea aquimaris TaxID=189382 RepID=A0A5D4TX31_9BACI|nr:hypothetical protein [Rossellomorea aquimaris]TYS79016.1 hypothetical protein FZD05_10865 [Rossellomorea aquimaris]TYS84761.1 hypothetical protein FZC85_15495 [Rossellomorea aquimaris]